MSDRPLLSLVMILKDEAKSIESVLAAAKPFIDRWCILDTGSTDGTQGIVRKTLADVPGVLFEEPFVDFATSRNRVMDLDKGLSVIRDEPCEPAVFQIMLSGDEYLRDGEALRKYLEENCEPRDIDCTQAFRDTIQKKGGAVPEIGLRMQIDCVWLKLVLGDMVAYQQRIFRTGSQWRYEGEVHEIPVNREDKTPMIGVVEGPFIEHIVSDPERRFRAIVETHIPLLEKRLDENPVDERALVFLAQSYGEIIRAPEPYRMQPIDRFMSAIGAMAFLKRRLAIPSGNAAERNWCEAQYLEFGQLAGIYNHREMLVRASELYEKDTRRPEVAYMLATAAYFVMPREEAYKAAAHAAKVAEASPDIGDSTPISTSFIWKSHHLAANIAKQLAAAKPDDGVAWGQRVTDHIEAGLKNGGKWEDFQKLMELPPLRQEPEAETEATA